MNVRTDIRGIEDIKKLVDDFYRKVAQDELLAPIFNFRLSTHWGPHLEKMYLFWNAALFGVKGYIGNPFSKHATMEVEEEHFERWLEMFDDTVDLYFEGPVAIEAKRKAAAMAEMFLRKIKSNKGNSTKPVL
ncbi:group III truncated hemoglobin [Daejeonella lutea]|uniref:Hemoglobin n=1 Tax=Daejeonella lutea TaxID=572036 RepID=A0A1T5DIW3_9SPHI|nr:group III truncated hemoglobin [Daejeonella lutea]SKB71639.1 hemoglobin [Daejeonella lutea]